VLPSVFFDIQALTCLQLALNRLAAIPEGSAISRHIFSFFSPQEHASVKFQHQHFADAARPSPASDSLATGANMISGRRA
jgi:hypothetical protein